MHVYPYVRMFVCTYICTYVSMYEHRYVHTHAYTQICDDINLLNTKPFCMSQIPVPAANADVCPCLKLSLFVFSGARVGLHSTANIKDRKAGLC